MAVCEQLLAAAGRTQSHSCPGLQGQVRGRVGGLAQAESPRQGGPTPRAVLSGRRLESEGSGRRPLPLLSMRAK